MPRRRVTLRQFTVYGDHGGGVTVEHVYRRCDWTSNIQGETPGEIMQIARVHARECRGEPQPRLPAGTVASGLIPGVFLVDLGNGLMDTWKVTPPGRDGLWHAERPAG
jgi:hypothetical protein